MKPYEMMNQAERETWNLRAVQLMDRMGGGFASALAVAFYRADSDNRARILAAWPDLFEKYRRIDQEMHADQVDA
jgi:2-oxo-4-hydroxy-4-carboxy--5-ureidoimidazoline (OHCU) decarboxylase